MFLFVFLVQVLPSSGHYDITKTLLVREQHIACVAMSKDELFTSIVVVSGSDERTALQTVIASRQLRCRKILFCDVTVTSSCGAEDAGFP